MAIKVNITGAAYTGKTVTFPAPCDCASVTDGLSINGEIYTVCDAMGKCVTGVGGTWAKGAQVSVVLDCENKKAFIISTGSYAPAGYGLGKRIAADSIRSFAEIDTFEGTGWFWMTGGYSINGNSIGNSMMEQIYASGNYGKQILHLTETTTPSITAPTTIERTKGNNVWGEWEWVNPPMNGKEYRTTERYLGKPVYAKAVSTGSLPNTGSTTFANIATNVYNVVDVQLVTYQYANGLEHQHPYPSFTNSFAPRYRLYCTFDSTSAGGTGTGTLTVHMDTSCDMTSCKGTLLVKYTKTSN